MYAMQYEIALPADYDMATIRHRVATKGRLLDNLPGLGLKAYGVREVGVDESTVNQYSPFYLWTDPQAMGRFLWGGGGFGGIINSFGRPTVQHWTGAAFLLGPSADRPPSGAVKRTSVIDAEADPETVVEQARSRLAETVADGAVHSAAVAVDPLRWELVSYVLYAGATPAGSGVRYRVLHLSSPHMRELA